jgi:hypothetical protein
MSEQKVENVNTGYGYASDEAKVSPFNFGGNFGNCYLTRFEWIPNGGAGGTEGEALDIVFKINGTDKNYRMFPVKHGFGKNQEKITDPNSQEFKDALVDFNARVIHILHCFIAKDVLQQALARPIADFKTYCNLVKSLFPGNPSNTPLDIFLQYQWNKSEGQNRTFLEIPKKMSYGAWLTPAQPGIWKEMRAEHIDENTKKALWYVNEKGEEHRFIKNGWFMLSPLANQQRDESSNSGGYSGSSTTNNEAATTQAPDAPTAPVTKPAAW